MTRVVTKRPGLCLRTAAVLLVAGCGAAGPRGTPPGAAALPPPPLSLVVIASRSGGHLEQLARVIEGHATPSETVVVTLPAAGPAAAAYVVRAGESLSSIAAAHQVPLAELEGANPQLGPLAGRDWNRIYPGEQVTVPDPGAAQPSANLLIARAQAGPPPPALLRLPERPVDATPFQTAQYERSVRTVQATNTARLAAWSSLAARQLVPWQRRVATELRSAGGPAQPRSAETGDVSASIQAAATTLAGLAGRRVLLVLDGGRYDPPAAPLAAGSLAGIRLVVANLLDPAAAPSWASAGSAAGGSVTTLDAALTELRLSGVVNGEDVSGGEP